MKRIILTVDTAQEILDAINSLKSKKITTNHKAIYGILDPFLIARDKSILNNHSYLERIYEGHTLDEPKKDIIYSYSSVPIPCSDVTWSMGNGENDTLLKYSEATSENRNFGNWDMFYFFENVVLVKTTRTNEPILMLAFMFHSHK